ncbi:MAG TPA: hypothetical protein VFT45_20775 [Longimicrobium sp.]|nr:hypothetical protein [Longimicrobium sp.]
MPARAGDTFLLTRGTGEVPHLWVILWGPAGGAQAYLAVYLTTLRPHSDRSCILHGGEHPFLQHETAVAYGAVQRWTDERLGELVAGGIARPRAPVSAGVLERLRAGFFASARTPHALRGMAVEVFGAVDPSAPASGA